MTEHIKPFGSAKPRAVYSLRARRPDASAPADRAAVEVERTGSQPGFAAANNHAVAHRPALRQERLVYLPPLFYNGRMSHTLRHKKRLLARVHRIAGQVAAIERALEHETECGQVMQLIAGARGAMAGLMAEVAEDHVRNHLVDGQAYPKALDPEAAEQLIELIRTYMR